MVRGRAWGLSITFLDAALFLDGAADRLAATSVSLPSARYQAWRVTCAVNDLLHLEDISQFLA